MEPSFPLSGAPVCKRCHQYCIRDQTTSGNENGNSGRWYYTCRNGHASKFATWDDYGGITNGNPKCWCQITSRRSTIKKPSPADFYSCAVGSCGFNQSATPDYEEYSVMSTSTASQYVKARPEVYITSQAGETEPRYRERRCGCCVVM